MSFLRLAKVLVVILNIHLGENLKNEMINVALFIWRANSVYDEDYLYRSKEFIEKCRFYIRLFYDLRQITLDNFAKWNISIQVLVSS